MINHKEITQKSEEWHIIKWAKIGGTLSAGLINKRKYNTLFIDILSQRNEEYQPFEFYSNADMERGNELEPFAREYLNTFLKVKFIETGWLQSEENELLGISPDGLTEDETHACEIKCLGRKAHTEALYKQDIPLDYIPQVIHYFTVNPKLEKLTFICFRPEAKKHFIKTLTRESEVNIGTEATKKILIIKDVVEIAQTTAKKILQEIKEAENNIITTF